MTGHLAENELHGGLSFIERALGVQQARELYEQETGKQLSQSELARRLKGDGYPVPQPHISRMQEAIQYLLPAIPTVLYAGLGRHQVEQLTSLRRAAERVWAARSTETGQSLDFPTLFQDVLTLFDSTAGNFSVQRVQDELIGQMVDLLHIEYDTLAFEITDSDRRWQVLSAEPTSTPESSATAPMPKQLPPPAPEAAPEPVPATPETSPEPSSPRASTSSGQTVQHTQEEPQAGEDHRAAMLQEHIVSPAGTTERLQSIQRLVADHTGEALPDFESNVLQSIPVQAGGLFPITDLWYIEPTLDDPERLRMHIAQFAREIASEAGIQEFIESCENGTGFLCQLHDVSAVADPRSRAILALLYVLSAPYLPAGLVTNGIDASILTENLGILLQGSPTATGSKDSKPQRLSDTSLVKLFRLIRLTRHLWDFEADSPNGGSAMTGS